MSCADDENHFSDITDVSLPQALLDERHGYLAFVAAKNPLAVHRLTQCKVTDPPMRETEPVPAQFYSNILVWLRGHLMMFSDCLKSRLLVAVALLGVPLCFILAKVLHDWVSYSQTDQKSQ